MLGTTSAYAFSVLDIFLAAQRGGVVTHSFFETSAGGPHQIIYCEIKYCDINFILRIFMLQHKLRTAQLYTATSPPKYYCDLKPWLLVEHPAVSTTPLRRVVRNRCRAHMAHTRQSRPDLGLAVQVKVINTFLVDPCRIEKYHALPKHERRPEGLIPGGALARRPYRTLSDHFVSVKTTADPCRPMLIPADQCGVLHAAEQISQLFASRHQYNYALRLFLIPNRNWQFLK